MKSRDNSSIGLESDLMVRLHMISGATMRYSNLPKGLRDQVKPFLLGDEMIKEIPDFVNERLLYDGGTGCFTWAYKNKMHPRLFGTPAGHVRDGYLVIKINGVALKASRIAWFITYGEQPNIIDHINGIKTDNRISNLRNVTQSENTKNHAKGLNNSGLPCGVRLLPSGKFQGRIACNNKSICLGIFETVYAAHAAYMLKRNELYGVFSRGYK